MYNIFIADDHTIIRQGLKRIIEEVHGYKVVGEIGDGLQILPQIKKLNPDMAILDISMPNLRGIEAIGRIRKVNKKIKILMLTMHKNEDYVYECLVSGAQGYVLKEDADTDLVSAIESIRQDDIYISRSFTSNVIKRLVQRKGDKRDKSSLRGFTKREREIIKLVAEGKSSKQIARLLSISTRTVEHHRSNIMKKLGVSNTVGLIKFAIKTGMVDLM